MADTEAPQRIDGLVVVGTVEADPNGDVAELLALLRLQAQLFERWTAGEFLRATEVHDAFSSLERAYAALAGAGQDHGGTQGRETVRIGRSVRRVGRTIDRIVVQAQLTSCPPDSTMSRMSVLAGDAIARVQEACGRAGDGRWAAIDAARASLAAMERAHDRAGHRIAVTGEVRTLADRMELYRRYEELTAAVGALADRLALGSVGRREA